MVGTFLHNYQTQLTRLIPFLSRVADLFQREALITNPRERLQTQEIARHVGAALHEIVYATAPVAHLIRGVRLGETPGLFSLGNVANSDLAPFVSAHMVTPSPQHPAPDGSIALDVPQNLAAEPAGAPEPELRLSEEKEKALATAVQGLQKQLAEFALHGGADAGQKSRQYASEVERKLDLVLPCLCYHLRFALEKPGQPKCKMSSDRASSPPVHSRKLLSQPPSSSLCTTSLRFGGAIWSRMRRWCRW